MLPNSQDQDKEQIIKLISTWRDRAKLRVNEIVTKMQLKGCQITRNTFENQFTTRSTSQSNVPTDWVIAIIHIFVDIPQDEKRCTADEALEFARLCRLPIDFFNELYELFPEEAFLTSFKRHAGFLDQLHPSETITKTIIWPSGKAKRWEDIGEAPDIRSFIGRNDDLRTLQSLIEGNYYRIFGILGVAGVGKTFLASKVVAQVREHFHYVIWRSLAGMPTPSEFFVEIIRLLSDTMDVSIPLNVSRQLEQLVLLLRQKRCLVVLDNFESIMAVGKKGGLYIEGYELYGDFLDRFGTIESQSTLILTSKEKPQQFANLERIEGSTHTIDLRGISVEESRRLLQRQELIGNEESWMQLVGIYSGNPLILNIVSETVKSLCSGDIAIFLDLSKTRRIFDDVDSVLNRHLRRLSDFEIELLFWLALEQESVTLSDLHNKLLNKLDLAATLRALQNLRRQSLIESTSSGFRLQNVILEFILGRFVDQVTTEILDQTPNLLQSHAILNPLAKEHIVNNQVRRIIQPVLARLISQLHGKSQANSTLTSFLKKLSRNAPLEELSYMVGNLLNLLVYSGADMSGLNLSNTYIARANLKEAEMHDTDFTNCHFDNCSFLDLFDKILTAVVDPSDQHVFAAGSTCEIMAWDIATGQHQMTLPGHRGWIFDLKFHPVRNLLASCSEDHTVRIWDLAAGKALSVLNHDDEVKSIAFSPTGDMLASASSDKSVTIWSTHDWTLKAKLTNHQTEMWCVAFSPNGNYIAAGCEDHIVRLWDSHSYELIHEFRGHTARVRSIEFSPDNRCLASGSSDKTVRIWHLSTAKCISLLAEHTAIVRRLAYHRILPLLASSSDDQTVRFWSTDTWECLDTVKIHTNWVRSVAFSQSGNYWVSGSDDQTIHVWDVTEKQPVRSLVGYTNSIFSLALSDDGSKLISGHQDGKVRIWDLGTLNSVTTPKGHNGWVKFVAISKELNLVASAGIDSTIILWDALTAERIMALEGHSGRVECLAFAPDTGVLVSGSSDNVLMVWNTLEGKYERILTGHVHWVKSVMFGPDGNSIISGGEDADIRVWDFATGECTQVLKGHQDTVWSLRLYGKNVLISASENGDILFWDLAKGNVIERIEKAHPAVHSIDVSGDLLVSGGTDRLVKVWSLEDMTLLTTFESHKGVVWTVLFHPDGQRIISGSEDGTIRIWRLDQQNLETVLKIEGPYGGMKIGGVSGLTMSRMETLRALGAIG